MSEVSPKVVGEECQQGSADQRRRHRIGIAINPNIDRRTILCAAGIGMGVATGGVVFPEHVLSAPGVRYVVTDSRFAEAPPFADALARQGASRLDAAHRLTAVWRETLMPHWRTSGGAVVGLTTSAAWHMLAEQARGEGRRSFLVGRHYISAGGAPTTHVITVREDARAAASQITGETDRWPAAVATLAGTCAAPGAPTGATCRVASALPGATDRISLLSWIIA